MITNLAALTCVCALALTACSSKSDTSSAKQDKPAITGDQPQTPSTPPQTSQPEKPQSPGAEMFELPDPTTVTATRWLEQGWTDEVRNRFHHMTQGTKTFPLPYEWFIALEQPSATPAQPSELLIKPAYLTRFGFIASEVADSSNPDRLPVGFSKTPHFEDALGDGLGPNPATGNPYGAVGFTCAACHTGQLEYNGTRLLIDGGQAMIDLSTFRDALTAAIGGLADPARAGRFMQRVLPPEASAEQRAGLAAQLEGYLKGVVASGQASQRAIAAHGVKQNPVEGFFRLDALGRIGNEIFWRQQRQANGVTGPELDRNYALTDAPVNYPHIWTAPWFDWVQYNGSIMQPMFRNFFEALGVGATVNLGPDPATQFRSTVHVSNLHQMEQELAGPPPLESKRFGGLTAPRWPEDVLGAIDRDLARQGQALYVKHCRRCHLPAPDSPEFWNDELWVKDSASGGRTYKRHDYLRLTLVPIDVIGTDPMQAKNMMERKIQLPSSLGGKVVSYAEALKTASVVIDRAYDAAKIPDAQRADMDGHRPNELRAELSYRPRPLDGVWATAPYLHNASVPSLYDLLSPVAERPAIVYLGSRAFDPKRVGVSYRKGKGLFKVDTTTPGNRNTGHEFNDGKGRGIIGQKLSEQERWALIEYIKTL